MIRRIFEAEESVICWGQLGKRLTCTNTIWCKVEKKPRRLCVPAVQGPFKLQLEVHVHHSLHITIPPCSSICLTQNLTVADDAGWYDKSPGRFLSSNVTASCAALRTYMHNITNRHINELRSPEWAQFSQGNRRKRPWKSCSTTTVDPKSFPKNFSHQNEAY